MAVSIRISSKIKSMTCHAAIAPRSRAAAFRIILCLLLAVAIELGMCVIGSASRPRVALRQYSDENGRYMWLLQNSRLHTQVVVLPFMIPRDCWQFHSPWPETPRRQIPVWVAQATSKILPLPPCNNLYYRAIAVGWPFRCAVGVVTTDPPNGTRRWFWLNDVGHTWQGRPIIVPYSLIPSAVAANLLVLSAPLYVALVVPRIALRVVRKRRGCCLKCGYSLMASQSQCPECGSLRELQP